MPLGVWLRVLRCHGWRIAPRRVPMALMTLLLGCLNSTLAALQRARYDRVITATPVPDQPVLITGHWRSGTTAVHEAFACDPSLAFPATYDCFAAAHVLVSKGCFTPWLKHLVPARRPLDAMPFGLDRPQEDEFALCVLGAPSPYLDWLLPNQPPQYERFTLLHGVSAAEHAQWCAAFMRVVKSLTHLYQRRLVLKSPLHTGRLATLLHLFPDARVVHIVRHPYAVIPSTMRLWECLQKLQGLQRPRGVDLSARVLAVFAALHEQFERDRHLLKAGRHVCVRYEELVADPLAQMQQVYEEIELPFDAAQAARLASWAAAVRAHRPAHHELTPELRARINQHCRPYIDTYGYAIDQHC